MPKIPLLAELRRKAHWCRRESVKDAITVEKDNTDRIITYLGK